MKYPSLQLEACRYVPNTVNGREKRRNVKRIGKTLEAKLKKGETEFQSNLLPVIKPILKKEEDRRIWKLQTT